MIANRILPRMLLSACFATAMLSAAGAAMAQDSPALPILDGSSLQGAALPSIVPTPVASALDDILGSTPSPNGYQQDLGGTLKTLLPPGVVVDPGLGGDPTGNGGTGPGGGGKGVKRTGTVPRSTVTGGIAPRTAFSSGTGSELPSVIGDAARRAAEARGPSLRAVTGRAAHLAVPMAAPISIAVAGVLGLVMLAKSNGRLDGLDDERKAIGGWTVIRL